MKKRWIAPKDGPPPVGPYSPAVAANGFVFVSGQIPLDPVSGEIIKNSFSAQARQALKNVKNVLQSAGCTLDDVVKVTIYLNNIDDFAELNEIYSEYFLESKPARACIEASRLPKGVDIEIECIALDPQ